MLRRINESLPGLVAGIIIYGVIVQLTGVWFVEDKLAYSIGLWYGIAIAIGMGINIAVVIYDTVTFYAGENTNKRVAAKSILRYGIVAILLFILGYFQIGNLFAAFLGVMGLKVSAYMQPLLMRLVNKLLGRDDADSCEEEFSEEKLVESENSEKINEEVTM